MFIFHPCDFFFCIYQIQIATAEVVFILDLRILGQGERASSAVMRLRPLFTRFVGNLLRDAGILKVGWDFLREDVRMLQNNSAGK